MLPDFHFYIDNPSKPPFDKGGFPFGNFKFFIFNF